MRRNHPWLLSQIKDIVKLYNIENWTCERIGKDFGITKERVRQILQGCGVDTSGKHRTWTERVCERCGKSYSAMKTDKTFRTRYCSQKCWRWKPKPVKVRCETCGKKFKVPRRRFDSNNSGFFFCGRRCQGIHAGKNYGFVAHPGNRFITVKR